ncbi:hypothetical protein [Rickettsiales endosymbiont of Stachyamoeba lipophora]|uniref:hypothetical protein n=1 Tax=Rickettsiales endosymbiont of Stachyamoeba lipophora TaxID=2486578 RepID=UPI000F64F591|nr:hypothetical protein [Rickettsiales endosymbiont of Stachyamoeba lipophora]AZL15267.1 hypothetical protein EF513_01680 [Rickettsiales endosymbiont of Stachyamoeba lipophora]
MIGKPKISIVILGKIHRDPMANAVAEELVGKLANQQIPIVFCTEKEHNPNLPELLAHLSNQIPLTEEYIKKNDLQKFFETRHGLKLPFVSLENQLRLLKELEKMPNSSSFSPSKSLQDIICIESTKKNLSLLKIIKELKVPYIGIDKDYHLVHSSTPEDHEIELKRINNMVTGVTQQAFKEYDNGSKLIICQGGIIHTHRFAASLMAFIQDNPNLPFDIAIYPVTIHSEYVQDQIPGTKEVIFSMQQNDSQVLKLLYRQMNAREIFFEEDQVTGTFKSVEFDMLISQAINHVKGLSLTVSPAPQNVHVQSSSRSNVLPTIVPFRGDKPKVASQLLVSKKAISVGEYDAQDMAEIKAILALEVYYLAKFPTVAPELLRKVATPSIKTEEEITKAIKTAFVGKPSLSEETQEMLYQELKIINQYANKTKTELRLKSQVDYSNVDIAKMFYDKALELVIENMSSMERERV